MPQIAHFQVEKWKSSLPSPLPHRPPARSLRSLAKIAPPNVLAHYATGAPKCVDPRYATVAYYGAMKWARKWAHRTILHKKYIYHNVSWESVLVCTSTWAFRPLQARLKSCVKVCVCVCVCVFVMAAFKCGRFQYILSHNRGRKIYQGGQSTFLDLVLIEVLHYKQQIMSRGI